jgi:NAD-dependent dihydropyrimidine dehydrogenase PreA subunit
MQREIIKIDEAKCTGCGECVPNCHEGALQVIDGKVRLVSELMCDGLGACIGHCPEDAITIEKREAQPYDEITTPASVSAMAADTPSQLTHWPVQMHLINPNSPVYRGADLLLAADCVAFSLGSFHQNFLKNRSLAIACPKLDHGTEVYIDKLVALIDTSKVDTITVMMMEVPCCGGLLQMVRSALAKASRKVPVKSVLVSIDGKILGDEWI